MKTPEGAVRKAVAIIIFFFVALFLYTKFAGPIPFYINSVNTTKADLFNVDGTGEATAVPDTGVVNLGITSQGSTVTEAQGKTNEIANKLIADIKKLGIEDKNIKTTNYSVTPNYGNGAIQPMMFPIRSGGQTIVGYTVTQNLEIDVKPIEKANKVVDTATADGANLVGQVSFSFSDDIKTQLENKARADAIKQAKDKAQNLANLSGIRLGKLVNVVESNQIRPWPMRYMGTAGNSGTPEAQPPTNITPGENTVSITVTLSYETF